MKVLLVLVVCAFAAVQGRVTTNTLQHDECEDVVHLNDHYYRKEHLAKFNGFPADMSIDWKTGNIFFTLVRLTMTMDLNVLRKGEHTAVKIKGMSGLGQSSAVDQHTGKVYLAGDSGLYVYNDATTSAEPFAEKSKDIMYLDVADKGKTIYYVTWEGHKVYKMPADLSSPAELYARVPKGHGIAVDSEKNFYYEDEKVSKMIRKGENEGVTIKNIDFDKGSDYFVDKHDNVWVSTSDGGLYKMDKATATAKFVGNLGFEDVNTIGIDADDNIIVGNEQGLNMLKKLERNPCHMNTTQ